MPAIKGSILAVAAAILLISTAGHAARTVSGLQTSTYVPLAISTGAPIQILLGDGVTVLASGDAVSFGTVEVDYWGTAPVPLTRLLVVDNSSTQQRVVVTGDMGDDILPVFGTSKTDLKKAPENEFILDPKGTTSDTMSGWLGLQFLNLATGETSTTIIFRARAVPASPLPTKIDFEDPGLGNLCAFADAIPLRNNYLQSHGVRFRGGTPASPHGLAVLHECSKLGGITSHGTGDYFLAGSDTAKMANEGVPRLPEVVTFIHPVSEVWFYACSCGKAGGYTLQLHGYEGPDATGAQIASDSRLTDQTWQLWKVTAPASNAFRSVKLSKDPITHNLVLDDLEWKWVAE